MRRCTPFARTQVVKAVKVVNVAEAAFERMRWWSAGNANCVESSQLPGQYHTQEVRGSSPLAPTIGSSPKYGASVRLPTRTTL